jgi:hypothetical protein
MFGEKWAQQLHNVPLSNNTFTQQTDDTSEDLEEG